MNDTYALSLELQINDLVVKQAISNIQGAADDVIYKFKDLNKVVKSVTDSIGMTAEDSVKKINSINASIETFGDNTQQQFANISQAAKTNFENIYDDISNVSSKLSELIAMEWSGQEPDYSEVIAQQDILISKYEQLANVATQMGTVSVDQTRKLVLSSVQYNAVLKERQLIEDNYQKSMKEFTAKYSKDLTKEQLIKEDLNKMTTDEIVSMQKLLGTAEKRNKLQTKPDKGILQNITTNNKLIESFVKSGGKGSDMFRNLGKAGGTAQNAFYKLATELPGLGNSFGKIGTMAGGAGRFMGSFGKFATGALGPIGLLIAAVDLLAEGFQALAIRAEKFHAALYRGLGSMESVATMSARITSSSALLNDEVDEVIINLRRFGASGKFIESVAETAGMFVRATGASVEAVAKFSTRITTATKDVNLARTQLAMMYKAAREFGLAGEDVNAVLIEAADSSMLLQAYGTEATKKYTEGLISAAAAAKKLNEPVEHTLRIMKKMKDPLSYLALLGPSALDMAPDEREMAVLREIPRLLEQFKEGMADPALRARTQIELGIRLGVDRGEVADELKRLQAMAEQKGVMIKADISTEGAKKSVKDIMNTAQAESSGVYRDLAVIGEKLLATLQVIVAPILKLVTPILKIAVGILDVVGALLTPTSAFLDKLMDIGGASDTITEIFQGLKDAAFAIGKALAITFLPLGIAATNIIMIGKLLWGIIKPIIDEISGIFSALSDSMTDFTEPIFDIFKAVAAEIGELGKLLGQVFKLFSPLTILGKIIKSTGPYVKEFGQAFINALKWVVKQIQWVTEQIIYLGDKLKEFTDWVGLTTAEVKTETKNAFNEMANASGKAYKAMTQQSKDALLAQSKNLEELAKKQKENSQKAMGAQLAYQEEARKKRQVLVDKELKANKALQSETTKLANEQADASIIANKAIAESAKLKAAAERGVALPEMTVNKDVADLGKVVAEAKHETLKELSTRSAIVEPVPTTKTMEGGPAAKPTRDEALENIKSSNKYLENLNALVENISKNDKISKLLDKYLPNISEDVNNSGLAMDANQWM